MSPAIAGDEPRSARRHPMELPKKATPLLRGCAILSALRTLGPQEYLSELSTIQRFKTYLFRICRSLCQLERLVHLLLPI
jgi:hypothetical protein